MHALRISVAMATYQGERYLEQQLKSILEQTLQPYELVIGDDQSCDGTVPIIRRFADRAPFPVRLQINAARLGHAENFVRTAERCSGDVIALCDQDDVWLPAKLRRCASEFRDPQVQLVTHDATIVDAAATPTGDLLSGRPRDSMRLKAPLQVEYGLTMVFRRHLAAYRALWSRSIGGMVSARDIPMGHDHWYYLLGSTLGEVVRLPDRLVSYRQHHANAAGAQAPVALSGMTPRYRSQYWADRAFAAKQRIRLLHELMEVAHPASQWRVGEALTAHEDYVELCHQRALVYGAVRTTGRAMAFGRIAAKRGYDGRHFGLKAIKSDLLFGVLGITAGPVLARAKRLVDRVPRGSSLAQN